MGDQENHLNSPLLKHLDEWLNLVGRTAVHDEDSLVVEIAHHLSEASPLFLDCLEKSSFTHLEKMLPVMKLFSVLNTRSSFSEKPLFKRREWTVLSW